jgi:STAM-binding protein
MLNADIPAPADAAPSTAKARYVVETLVIPTQHAPRNTCTADEENDMLRLTEERGFITLGWVSGASLPFSFPFRP